MSNELAAIEKTKDLSVDEFLEEYYRLKEKNEAALIDAKEKELYNEYCDILSNVGDSLNVVKNSTLVYLDNCKSLFYEDKKDYVQDVYFLTGGFNKDFMNEAKEMSDAPAVTVIANKQVHNDIINAPLSVNEIKSEILKLSTASVTSDVDMKNVFETNDKVQANIDKYSIDRADIVNSTLSLTIAKGKENELNEIADLKVDKPEGEALYEIYQIKPDTTMELSGIAPERTMMQTTGRILIEDGLDAFVLNKDTQESFELSADDFKERLTKRLDSKEEFEQAKYTAPVITTNDASEIGTVRNGQAVVLEAAHSRGDLEKETAGSSAETITNEELRFEETIGRKITDIELIKEVIEEMITEQKIDDKTLKEVRDDLTDVDDIGNEADFDFDF